MRKEGWKEIWFKKKKKFPRDQNPKSTMTLTDDVNIIVAKSKNSILYTRHVPLTYTIANRANRFSMLRFELGWPTWMTTSSTFINLFFFFFFFLLSTSYWAESQLWNTVFRLWGKREKKENNFSFTLRDDNYINHIYYWQ